MRIFLLFLFLLLTSCRSFSGHVSKAMREKPVSIPVSSYGNSYPNGPASFALTVNLKLLKDSKEDEIRVWYKFLGSLHGTVVTKDSITEYSNRESGRLELVKTDASTSKVDLMKYLPSLSKLSEFTYHCPTGIHGGNTYYIEGNYNGKYFSTVATSPQSCSSPEFDAINEFLRAVRLALTTQSR